MRHLTLLFLLIICLNTEAFCQDKKYTVRAGAGYYLDTFGMVDGQIFWLEGGAGLKSGFNLNGRYSMAYVSWVLSEGPFQDYKTMDLRQIFGLTFSKPIKLGGNHSLEPGFGFLLKREFYMVPSFSYIYSGGTYHLSTSYSDITYEIGVSINLDYNFQLSDGKYFGLRVDNNIIWGLGFEGVTVSPLFGFRF